MPNQHVGQIRDREPGRLHSFIRIRDGPRRPCREKGHHVKASIRCRIRRAALVAVIGLMAATSSQAATVYVSTTGNDANDGLTWGTARLTVQVGLNAAIAGDQVWVAAGAYVQRITLKGGVALYGGFAGTETDLTQRNWAANVTILDGNQAGSVVTASPGTTASTRVDGFTIRNGNGTRVDATFSNYGGGIYCNSASPTIANNTITGNVMTNWKSYGAGICCYSSSSPQIINNTIIGNSATPGDMSYGGAIHADSAASPTIANNVIAGNIATWGGAISCGASSKVTNNTIVRNTATFAGGGIYCSSGSPSIINNTITSNEASRGGGVQCDIGSNPTIRNTIIAFNASGVYTEGGTLSLRCNCVYGNGAYNYSGLADPAGTDGNVSTDPKLANRSYRDDVHIQPDSPCVGAGDDAVVQAGWTDMDGQARILGPHVDIGADESDGTAWPSGPGTIVRVASDGNDANDGSSWAQPKRSLQAAIDEAAALGGEVWVKAGTYPERISLRRFVYVYGGFSGAEADRPARDWAHNVTVLDGGQGGSVVMAVEPGYTLSAIDGFTIRNGNGTPSGDYRFGGGVYCENSSPIIANDTITGNSASYSGGGIYCHYASPVIINNTITANTAVRRGGGIHCFAGAPTISNNTITKNDAVDGGGIYSEETYFSAIAGNMIAGNSGAGIYLCYGSSPVIANNTIKGCSRAGIYCTMYAKPAILNNTVTGNFGSGISYGEGPYFVARKQYNQRQFRERDLLQRRFRDDRGQHDHRQWRRQRRRDPLEWWFSYDYQHHRRVQRRRHPCDWRHGSVGPQLRVWQSPIQLLRRGRSDRE